MQVLCAGAGLVLSFASSAEIYRWVDENGNVHFSDRYTRESTPLERHVLDSRGNLVEVLHRQRTVAELEQHRARLAAMTTEAEKRRRQDDYDRYLLGSFESLQDLESLRDERLQIRDAQITDLKAEVETLAARVARENEKRVTNVIAQQNLIRTLEADLEALRAKLAEVEGQRNEEFEGLSADMRRYEFLTLQRAIAPR